MVQIFFHFSKFWFLGFLGGKEGKRATNGLKFLFQYVMLYISGTVDQIIEDHIIEILLMISTGIFLFFKKKKYNIVNLKNYFVFYWPTLIYLFFKFINKCKIEILRFAPLSSHVCDFFMIWIFLSGLPLIYWTELLLST